jgi:hypothetical protein
MKMPKTAFLLTIFFGVAVPILTACAPGSNLLGNSTSTLVPTNTPFPTYTPIPTFTPFPTYTPIPTLTAYPTYTPFPIPTATPTLTPTPQKKELFKEDFTGSTTCFDTTSNETADRSVRDGKFHLRVKIANKDAWTACSTRSFSDFAFEVDATEVDGFDDNGYGIVFRRSGSAFYYFEISGDGQFTLRYYDGTNTTAVVGWTAISEVKRGRTTNHLKVVAIGNQIELFVNAVSVARVLNNKLSSGQIALIATAFSLPNVYITFDNVSVMEP